MQEIISTLTSRERLHRRGVCVIVPTFNNETTIRDVVERCKEQSDDIIVVNDGCTDSTASILVDMKGITVVTLDHNSGKGTALKTGFRKALEMGFSYAITLDADGQHFPEDIPLMLKANIENPGALIVGERKELASKERSRGSKFANAFSNFWFFVQTWKRLKDTQTGFRLYPLRKLHGLSLLTSRYEAELELLVFAAWHGVKLVSQPINVYYPPREQRVSHFRPGIDFTRIFILNTILCFLACVYGLPLYIWRAFMVILRTTYSLLFFVVCSIGLMTPLVTLYIKIGKMTLEKRDNLHGILQWISKFIMVWHGIPGVKYKPRSNSDESLDGPSVLICNHQSHLDLMTLLPLKKKIVVLTNDWVWRNPFYGYVIRQAEFYPVSAGVDTLIPKLRSLVDRGYSVAVYPEGTRSEDCSIGRFHQGAFYIAEQLNLDIVPLILYGAGKVLPKKDKHLHKGIISLDVDRHFSPEEIISLGTLKQRASWFRKYYKSRYDEVSDEYEQYA